jgi:hypothetical protein
MRWLLALIVVIAPVIAAAKPSVAIAPFEGDKGNKVANAVAKAIEDDAGVVVGPKETGKAMDKLGLSAKLDKKDQKKLRKKLEVDVIIEGKIEDKELELRLAGKGVKTSRFKVGLAGKYQKELKSDLSKRLEPAESDDDKEEEDVKPPPKVTEEDDRPKKKKKKKKRSADSEESDSVEEDGDAEPAARHVVTQAAFRANVGVSFARRGLTYDGGNQAPPSIGTAAPGARVEVEGYPLAMDTLKGAAAGIGFYADFDRVVTLSIDVPGTSKSAPITQQHYAIGARYRLAFGTSTIAFGLGYAARQYKADQSGLGMTKLDMPNVDYGAIAPNVVARFAATPMIGIFAATDFQFMLKAGQITKDFGYAKIIAFDIVGGADIAFTKRYGLRAALELNQVGFSFSKPKRGVDGATDRTIGLAASFEVLY